MNIDGTRAGGCRDAHARGEQLRETSATAGAKDDLGRVDGAGEVEQRGRHIGAGDLVIRATEALHQQPLTGQQSRVGIEQPVGSSDMDGQQVSASGSSGDPRGPADQRLAFGSTGQADHDPFPGLPGLADAVVGPVPVQLLVDLVRQPEQGELRRAVRLPTRK